MSSIHIYIDIWILLIYIDSVYDIGYSCFGDKKHEKEIIGKNMLVIHTRWVKLL